MAKILTEGRAETWWVGQAVTCQACGVEFEVEASDYVTDKPYFDNEQMTFTGTAAWMDCPSCSRLVKIEPEVSNA